MPLKSTTRVLFWLGAAAITAFCCVVCASQPAAAEQPPAIRPLTAGDAAEAWQRVIAAGAAVDQRFIIDPANADGWRKYLDWDKFQAELQKPSPDPKIVGQTYERLAAGYNGLELRHFYDLRTALQTYLTITSGIGNAELKTAVDERLAELAAARKLPRSAEVEQAIADDIAWLDSLHQAGDTVQAVRGEYGQPNFQIHIGGKILGSGVDKPVDETAPVEDCILGTSIHGCGRTIGNTSLVLCPDPCHCAFELVMQGTNGSVNTGYHSPVTIQSTGSTSLYASRQVWIDAAGVHIGAVAANATAHTTIQGICDFKGRQFVTNIANRKAQKQMPEAEAIASAHASARLSARFDEQSAPRLQDLSRHLNQDLQNPLVDQGIFPRTIAYSTDSEAIHVVGVQAGPEQLAAPDAPPVLTVPNEMSATIHESAVNNMTDRFLTGMRLTDAMVQKISDRFPHAQDRLVGADKEGKNESTEVDFPGDPAPQIGRKRPPHIPPVTVSFVDNGFTVTLRAAKFFVESNELISGQQPGMNVAASYTFQRMPQGYKAVRQGPLNIYAFGKRPDSPRDFRQISIATAMRRKFEKVFAQEIKLEGFKPQGELASMGKIVPVEIVAKSGWLAIGWRRE